MPGGKPPVTSFAGQAWRTRVARWALVAVSPLILAGCGLLYPGYYDVPNDASLTPLAVYRNGQATVTLGDGTRLVLDEVAADSNLVEAFGATVHWIGPDGWHVRLIGASPDFGLGAYAFLQFDRIADGEHLTTWDTSRCIVDVDLADETGVRGSATCKGLAWSDALAGDFGAPFASPSAGNGPTFDAEVEFEAFPAADRI
jgi:hypothetical protein